MIQQSQLTFFLISIIHTFLLIICVLLSVAIFTLLERKVLGVLQRRAGPNVIGIYGILQPIADGLKLLTNEVVIPATSSPIIFILAPGISFFLSILGWAVLPLDTFSYTNITLAVLYNLCISSLAVYGIILSGWASNTSFSLLGGLRSSAQMLAYELPLAVSLLCVLIGYQTFSLEEIVLKQENIWNCFLHPVPFFIFFIAAVAETSRHPFDLPEAEAELVSGFNTEYSGMLFALFSLAEYSSILLMCCLLAILFCGGNAPFLFFSIITSASLFWLMIKVIFFSILFIFARAGLPRFRYDQLMNLGWKIILPVSLAWFFFSLVYNYISFEKIF